MANKGLTGYGTWKSVQPIDYKALGESHFRAYWQNNVRTLPILEPLGSLLLKKKRQELPLLKRIPTADITKSDKPGQRISRGRARLAQGAIWDTIPPTMAKRRAKKKARRPSRGKGRKRAGGSVKLPKEAVTLVVLLRAREGQETLLEAELRALVGPSRKEEGCLRYDLHRCVDTPGALLLHEVWSSREAHTEHTHTRHFLRWNARKDALLTSREANFWKQIA
jgi:quinol monooxygenase YgiN